MIISRPIFAIDKINNKFVVLEEDTRTKQDIAEYKPSVPFKTKTVKLVAQRQLENSSGYELEDENGRIHVIGYRFYVEYEIDKLMLPEIEIPKPYMSIEEAIAIVTAYAPECMAKMAVEEAFVLPINYCKARDILGRETTKTLLESVINIYKARI